MSRSSLVESVLDNLPVAVFAKDATDDFRFVLWNQKQEVITGLQAEKAVGRNDYDLFSKESADYFRDVDKAVLKKGKPLEVPDEVVETALGEIHMKTVKIPVVDSETGRLLVVGISEDITERVKAREQLEKMNKDLSKTNQELQDTQMQLIQAEKLESIGRLAAGVAHEVKNPLAMLLLGVDYLSKDLDPEDPNIDEILIQMKDAIHRADRIVRGLVDFSSNRSLTKEETTVTSLVEEVLLLVRHEITKASVKITEDVSEDLPPVYLDTSKFQQVMINLIMNAVHAMAETEKPTLKISAKAMSLEEVEKNQGARTYKVFRKGDLVVVLEIRDNGSGISDANVAKLFDPFFTTKATGVGTGLGLSVVRKIVELHNGEISLNNRKNNQGAIVQIILPTRAHAEVT